MEREAVCAFHFQKRLGTHKAAVSERLIMPPFDEVVPAEPLLCSAA